MAAFINHDSFIENGFHISTDKTLLDIDVIYDYLNDESYWARGMPREKLEKAVANSMCFGIYKQYKLCGFARVVTDNATFAYLCDVFILPDFRKIGLSKWLVQTIVNHPELSGLRRWSLATADAQGLYSQFGFVLVTKPELWMEIHVPYKPL
jgi:N-acetylglutamate synthase-like GNAT family acetyltransferase